MTAAFGKLMKKTLMSVDRYKQFDIWEGSTIVPGTSRVFTPYRGFITLNRFRKATKVTA